MSPTMLPPSSESPPAADGRGRPRVFGDRPFCTDGDLIAVAFGPNGGLWSVEDPGVLRHWDARGEQRWWHALGGAATAWCFDGAARLLAGGSDELALWDVATGQLRGVVPQP